ncbi:MAG: DUF3786 domain-containing protein [Candidatus Omnitrophica bacterium]|nr:DUF3786 domain-containing protein [Candidatus Omnitrophota bacterium]
MGYEVALNKAWDELSQLTKDKQTAVKFLADEYSVDFLNKKVLSLSCNVPAKDFSAILILHYLEQKIKGLPRVTGEWLTFRELSGIEGYYPAFKKRSIDPIVRKYGSNPKGILSAIEKLPAKKAEEAEMGIVVNAFEDVPVLVKVWGGDDEFGPDANIYFDRSVIKIFPTEDIVVLAGIVASSI